MTFDWNWEFAFEILPRLLRATINTLIAAGVGYGIAMILGVVFALALRSSGRLPRTLHRRLRVDRQDGLAVRRAIEQPVDVVRRDELDGWHAALSTP